MPMLEQKPESKEIEMRRWKLVNNMVWTRRDGLTLMLGSQPTLQDGQPVPRWEVTMPTAEWRVEPRGYGVTEPVKSFHLTGDWTVGHAMAFLDEHLPMPAWLSNPPPEIAERL